MKKLFISCPMRGRTKEAIEKTYEEMHKLAETFYGEELEVIESFVTVPIHDSDKSGLLWLGESIKCLADADFFIGISEFEEFFRGCCVEAKAARMYNIPSFYANFEFSFLKDCGKAIDDYYRNEKYQCTEAVK